MLQNYYSIIKILNKYWTNIFFYFGDIISMWFEYQYFNNIFKVDQYFQKYWSIKIFIIVPLPSYYTINNTLILFFNICPVKIFILYLTSVQLVTLSHSSVVTNVLSFKTFFIMIKIIFDKSALTNEDLKEAVATYSVPFILRVVPIASDDNQCL